MKINHLTRLLGLLLTALALSAATNAPILERARASSGNFNYVVHDGTATVTGCIGTCPLALEIPSQLDGFTVTKIADWAFDLKSLTSVLIPNSVTQIGMYAFAENYLTTLDLPDSVTEIGRGAFKYNRLLTTLTLGRSLQSIGNESFEGNSISSLVIPASVTSIGTAAFSLNALTSLTIHDGVSRIGNWAFYGNELTAIVIPNSVTEIGSGAFHSNHLSTLQIGNSVTLIGDGAFSGNNLSTVVVPDAVTYIGSNAFRSNHLASLSLGTSVDSIGESAFASNNLVSLTIPDSVTSIAPKAFQFNQLSALTVGDGLLAVGGEAFADNYLVSVIFMGNAPEAAPKVFHNNSNLTSIFRKYYATGWGTFWPLTSIPILDDRSTQLIYFPTVADRNTAQPLTFNVIATANSGLPVSLTASGSCSVSGVTVSVLDKGHCTLTAAQSGSDEWLPAEPVTRTFTISRVLLSNQKITFRDASGALVAGLKVSWRTPDGAYSSASAATTNSSGTITFGKIPGGAVEFTLSGIVGVWDNGAGAYQSVPTLTMPVGSGTTSIVVGPSLSEIPRTVSVKVMFDDGTPVPGATVQVRGAWPLDGRYTESCLDSSYSWYLRTCDVSGSTGVDGIAKLVLPGSRITTQIYARFSDVDLVQTSGYVAVGEDGAPQIVLETLPVVVLETEAVTINFGASQTVTAIARDSDGSPIAGRSLTLSASTSGASASCSGRKTTATTNSAGRATFKVCPVKTATWSVDGRSIVGSAGVRFTVQLTPTAPRTLVATAKTRSVSLAWAAPAKANASTVTDYIVQYRLQGSSTWITFRDGTSTARKATVMGLTSGQIYEFRVAAKNKSGTGTWSVGVLCAAK